MEDVVTEGNIKKVKYVGQNYNIEATNKSVRIVANVR
jgi:hypothetical protein